MDVLNLFLDDDDVAVTAKPSEKVTTAPEQSDELDMLMEEFRSSTDKESQRDALMAMFKIARK